MIYNLKKLVPVAIKKKVKAWQAEKLKKFVADLPKLNEEQFILILRNELSLKEGDNVFVHSSIDRLNLDFPFYNVINFIRDVIGHEGTMLFPTYPKLNSYEFLKAGEKFNVRRTPTYTGALNEMARRHSEAIRSLHPTKSVVAIGPLAKELTNQHHLSPYPYDKVSPYYLISEHNTKIIGLGVKTTYLSAVHVIDDVMRERFPVKPYHSELFRASCINYEGNEQIVETYAHDMNKMNFSLPKYFAHNIDKQITRDINIDGMNFFLSHSKEMLAEMQILADKGITIYDYR